MAHPLIEKCGCEIRRADGTLDVNAMKAVAFERDLIQNKGFEQLTEVDRILDNMITKKPGNPTEGENPREEVEYRFGLETTNLAASDFLASGDALETVRINTQQGVQDLEVRQKLGGSLGCDPRSVKLVGGRDDRTGYHKMLPDIESPCLCVLDFARVDDFAAVLRAIRRSMPEEMAYVKERVLLREAVANAWYNTSESGAQEPIFTRGYFPHEPVAGANIQTFRKIRDRHKRQGHRGPIEVPISLPSLQAMMVHYYTQMGIEVKADNWRSGNFELTKDSDGQVSFLFEGSIRFILHDTPIAGIFRQVATDRVEFEPISPRKWRAGTGAGVIYDYDSDYDKTEIVLGGQEFKVFELIPILSPQAFTQHPFVMRDPGIEGVGDQMMWTGTTVRVITGAFIPDNEKMLKFYMQLSHAFKFVARKPYLASFVAIRRADYPRSANLIGLTSTQAAEASATIHISGGRQADATSRADVAAGYDPLDPAPGPHVYGCPGDDPNTAGNLRTPCIATVDETAGTVTLSVERINGSEGAASIAWALNDGTGVAGTDYTDASGTLNWADEEAGAKSITVTIPATARHGKTFTVAFSSVTGATLVASGCSTATVTINRPAQNYELAAGVTGALTGMTVNSGAFALPNAPYAATAAGASALQDDINDLLGGDGVANVTFATDWNITISGSRQVFNSATDGTNSRNFSVV